MILNKVMDKMVGDFKTEIKSVKTQFFVYLISYVTRCLWNSFALYYNSTPQHQFSYTTWNILWFLMLIVWQVVPTFTVVTLHHKAFKNRQSVTNLNVTQNTNNCVNFITTNEFRYATESASSHLVKEDREDQSFGAESSNKANITSFSDNTRNESNPESHRQTS